MEEKDKILAESLKTELQWVKYRIIMLDLIEEKILQMKRISKTAKETNFGSEEIEAINTQIHDLEEQIKALDDESRK